MEPITRLIPVVLPNGHAIQVEARVAAEAPVTESAGFAANFDPVIGAIEGIAQAVGAAVAKAAPTKTTVELGLEVAVESGRLTALLVKGSGKANLKISLTWGA